MSHIPTANRTKPNQVRIVIWYYEKDTISWMFESCNYMMVSGHFMGTKVILNEANTPLLWSPYSFSRETYSPYADVEESYQIPAKARPLGKWQRYMHGEWTPSMLFYYPQCSLINLMWPSATQIWANIGSANGLLPDDTKPISEPLLTYHQLCAVACASHKFHKKSSRCVRKLPF